MALKISWKVPSIHSPSGQNVSIVIHLMNTEAAVFTANRMCTCWWLNVAQCRWCHSATFPSQCRLYNVEHSIFLIHFLPLPRRPMERTRIMTLQWPLKVFNLSQHWVSNTGIWGLTIHATAVWLLANGTKKSIHYCLHNFDFFLSTTKIILNPAYTECKYGDHTTWSSPGLQSSDKRSNRKFFEPTTKRRC